MHANSLPLNTEPDKHDAEVAGGRRSSRTAAWLACGVVVVGIAAHLAYAWFDIEHGVKTTARVLAEAIHPAGSNGTTWISKAQAFLDAATTDPTAVETRIVVDASATVVARNGTEPASFMIERKAPIGDPKSALGEVLVSRPLTPLLWAGLIDLALGGVLGVLLFFPLRKLVTMVAGRTQGRMERRVSQVREESAHVLRVLFDRSDDGLVICAGGGRVLACNPASERMFGAAASAIVGTNIADWLGNGTAREADAGFLVTAGETIARQRNGGVPFAAQVEVHETHQDGESRYIVSVRDLTEQRQTQQKLEYLANFDSLTGLPNRVLFRDRLAQSMERARRSGQPMALMFLDLDRFKVVNDSLGHEVGDALLRHVAQTLTQCLRSVDTVGRDTDGTPFTLSRLGGDEFTVIADAVGGAEDAAMIARRLLEALAVPFAVGDEELHVSASIGISMYPMDDVDLDGMIRHTDMAMYRSKSMGRNTYSFFSDDLNAAVSARLSLEGALRRALERKEFCLYYQPKADLMTGRVTGVEALLRWHCPGRGMVPPDRFIAVLEDTGLIVQVGAWVIRAACKQIADWDRAGLPQISLAVNLSARQLRHPYLVALVADTLRETGIEPSRLELELTESLLMEDTDVNRGVLAAFARLGVRLAIDDFGTGHSSLSYLRRLDVDTLKIDRSFVTEIPHDAEDCAIATAILALGKSLQMKVVAEGVETQEQAAFLRDLGCTEMQGWLLSRAQPAAQMATWLQARDAQYQLRTNPRRYGADDGNPMPSIVVTREPAETVY